MVPASYLSITLLNNLCNKIIYFIALASYTFDQNEESKAAKYGPLMNETVPLYMNKFESIVGENNGYFVNGKVNLSMNIIYY